MQAAMDRRVLLHRVKVKGHSDHAGNDMADQRANWAQNDVDRGKLTSRDCSSRVRMPVNAPSVTHGMGSALNRGNDWLNETVG